MHDSARLLAFLFVVWLTWIPAAVLQKRAAGDPGGTSIVPVIPLFPLLAWAAARGLDLLAPSWGTRIVGSLHLLLLVAMLTSIVRSCHTLATQTVRSGSPPSDQDH